MDLKQKEFQRPLNLKCPELALSVSRSVYILSHLSVYSVSTFGWIVVRKLKVASKNRHICVRIGVFRLLRVRVETSQAGRRRFESARPLIGNGWTWNTNIAISTTRGGRSVHVSAVAGRSTLTPQPRQAGLAGTEYRNRSAYKTVWSLSLGIRIYGLVGTR